MSLRPVPGPLQAPAVDDVANKVNSLSIVVSEEVEQPLCLATARAQVNIGNKNCPMFYGFSWILQDNTMTGLSIRLRILVLDFILMTIHRKICQAGADRI